MLPTPALPPRLPQAASGNFGGTFITSFGSVTDEKKKKKTFGGVVEETKKRKQAFHQYEAASLIVPDDSETLDQILIVIARNEICTDPSFFRMLDKLQNRSGSESPAIKTYAHGENFDAATALKNKKLIQSIFPNYQQIKAQERETLIAMHK